ncbi:hypothetical protein SAMN05421773_10577 [Streptomyces aidingensis]|uniref:DUF732 domain-containing protein n=2 Tax=Streptomyces aidingensis TaxID=910347 RepID=A0A1I1LCE9_9ACTN|nr:hypothetical protein SAMN05421773_10577 [Streptomyces aidingensis]
MAAAVLTAAAVLAACSSGSGEGPAEPSASATQDAGGNGPADNGGEPESGTTSGTDDDEGGKDGDSDAGGGSAGGDRTGGEEAEEADEPFEGADELGKPVPEEEIREPEDRAFSPAEQEYLEDTVPEGTDPGAILATGYETCERVGYVAGRDRQAAVEALRTGEITGAEEAIPALCPEYQDLLDEANGKD